MGIERGFEQKDMSQVKKKFVFAGNRDRYDGKRYRLQDNYGLLIEKMESQNSWGRQKKCYGVKYSVGIYNFPIYENGVI